MVIQEIGLSTKLKVCRRTDARDWDEFVFLARNDVHMFAREYLQMECPKKKLTWDENQIEILLENFQYAKCEDLTDKIYDFLGLTHGRQDGSLEADYSKSIFNLYADILRSFHHWRVHQNGLTNNTFSRPSCTQVSRFIKFSIFTIY